MRNRSTREPLQVPIVTQQQKPMVPEQPLP